MTGRLYRILSLDYIDYSFGSEFLIFFVIVKLNLTIYSEVVICQIVVSFKSATHNRKYK